MSKYTFKLFRYVPNMPTGHVVGEHYWLEVLVKSGDVVEHQEMIPPVARVWANRWLQDHFGEVAIFVEHDGEDPEWIMTLNNKLDMQYNYFKNKATGRVHLKFKYLNNREPQ